MFENDISTISNTLPHFTNQGVITEVETQSMYLLSVSSVLMNFLLMTLNLCDEGGGCGIVFVFLTFLTFVKFQHMDCVPRGHLEWPLGWWLISAGSEFSFAMSGFGVFIKIIPALVQHWNHLGLSSVNWLSWKEGAPFLYPDLSDPNA